MLRKPPGVPSVPPPEVRDIWDEGDGFVAEPGIPGIDDEEDESLPAYHTYYQFIRPPVDIELPDDEGNNEDDEEDNQSEDSDGDSDSDEEMTEPEKPAAPEPLRPTTLQQRMLAIAGQDAQTVIQEMDYLHRQKEMNRQVTFESRKARMEAGDFDEDPAMGHFPPPMGQHPPFQRPPMMPSYPMGPPPAYGGFGPPSMPGGPARLPPGPPPRMPPGMAPRMIRPPGMPPPPPPGKMVFKFSTQTHF